MTVELMHEFKVVTGWTEYEIDAAVSKLNCSYSDALHFYKRFARLPNLGEQKIINEFGIKPLFSLINPVFQN